MNKTTTLRFFWIIVACLIAHITALLLMSAYIATGASFPYTEPIQWARLFDGFSRINGVAIKNTVWPGDWFLLLSGLAGLGIVLWTRNQIRSIWRFAFFVIQPAIFHSGWIGLVLLVAFPFEAISGLDGEWLGEYSPVLMSFGCWIAASLFIAFRSLKVPKSAEAQPA